MIGGQTILITRHNMNYFSVTGIKKFSSQAGKNKHYPQLCVSVTSWSSSSFCSFFPGTPIIASHAYICSVLCWIHLSILRFSLWVDSVTSQVLYPANSGYFGLPGLSLRMSVWLCLDSTMLVCSLEILSRQSVIWGDHRSHFVFLLVSQESLLLFLDV